MMSRRVRMSLRGSPFASGDAIGMTWQSLGGETPHLPEIASYSLATTEGSDKIYSKYRTGIVLKIIFTSY